MIRRNFPVCMNRLRSSLSELNSLYCTQKGVIAKELPERVREMMLVDKPQDVARLQELRDVLWELKGHPYFHSNGMPDGLREQLTSGIESLGGRIIELAQSVGSSSKGGYSGAHR